MIKGILFDKDGTLIDFNSTQHHIIANILMTLRKKHNVSERILDNIKEVTGYLPTHLKSDSMVQHSTTTQIVDAWVETIKDCTLSSGEELLLSQTNLLTLFKKHALSEKVPYELLTGTKDTLEYLNNQNYKLGIATADAYDPTVASLKKTEIYHYFQYLGTDCDDSTPKPSPFMAETFCAESKMTKEELLIVGDSENDMLFAQNAGAHFIGVATHSNDALLFRNNGHKVVSEITEIIDVFHL